MTKGKVGIVGSGLIGKSWAMIFASVGYEVTITYHFNVHMPLAKKIARNKIGLDV